MQLALGDLVVAFRSNIQATLIKGIKLLGGDVIGAAKP